eukprot:g9290.t1
MKRSASACFESSSPPESFISRKTQSVQRKRSSMKGSKDDYPSPFRLKQAPNEDTTTTTSSSSTKPLTPLPVNAESSSSGAIKPTEKELLAAKEARIRLGYDHPETGQDAPVGARLPTGDEPVKVVEAEYIPTEKLVPLDDAKAKLESILLELDSKNWQEMVNGINNVRRLVVHNSELAKSMLDSLVTFVLQLVKNPRSLVSKTAVLCITDMVSHLGDEMIQFLDVGGPQKPAMSVLCQLFLKSTTDKQFVVEEVQKTLKVIGERLSTDKTVDLLVPYTQHKNQKIRGKAGLVLVNVVDRIQDFEFTDPVLIKLLQVAANLITDKTPDAREAAKHLISKLRSVHSAQQRPNEDKKANQSDAVVDINVTTSTAKSNDSYLSYSDDDEE